MMLESMAGHEHGCVNLNGSWNQDSGLRTYENLSPKSYITPSFVTTFTSELQTLTGERRIKRISLLLIFILICCTFLLIWCGSTRSIALQAYMYTVGFNLLSLLSCVLSIWVEKQSPSPEFSFGYERFEVLAVFASTILAQLGSLFITKESFERLVLEQPDIHTGRLMVGTGVGFVCHMVVIYGCNNTALNHVIAASSSSWLQEHVSDISRSVCSLVPVLSGFLLPRVNPMVLIACAGAVFLVLTNLLIEINQYHMFDTLAAVSIAVMMCATMLPMSVYSGKVLLQTTPSHMVGQLDKCLRETLTIDGVLEFRNEHFWTLSFGRMAGSLQVRVRRDASEQLVLAHVYARLSNLVSVLTVQVFKDEWAVRRSGPPLAPTMGPPLQNGSVLPFKAPEASPQRKNPFGVDATVLPELLTPSIPHSGNLLISGTRTLDSERFAYAPR